MVEIHAADTGWTAAQTAIVLTAILAILGAILSTSVTYALNQRAARRERQAKTFAEALGVVEEYAELPYRVRRRGTTSEARLELTDEISRVQARLAYHQALMQIEAPTTAEPYALLVRAAKVQAGAQMKEAWNQPPLVTDADMSLGIRYPRDEIDDAREKCIAAMRSALRSNRFGKTHTLPTATSDLEAKTN